MKSLHNLMIISFERISDIYYPPIVLHSYIRPSSVVVVGKERSVAHHYVRKTYIPFLSLNFLHILLCNPYVYLNL